MMNDDDKDDGKLREDGGGVHFDERSSDEESILWERGSS
jgi:hypothetical protein